MKLPRFNSAALADFAVRHGEKIVVGFVGLGALLLLWGGIDALRSLSVSATQTPEAMERVATQARGHIDRDAQPPADLLAPRTALADSIDPWRTPLVPWKSGSTWLAMAPAPALPALNNPLFEEAAKRDKPEVFPIEDLRAVAGIAVVPDLTQRDVPELPRPPQPPNKPPKKGGAAAKPNVPLPPVDFGPAPIVEQSRLVPYVIVTGLIPVKKQQDEFARRFASTSYSNGENDRPKWDFFRLERTTVVPGGTERWEPVASPAAPRGDAGERADAPALLAADVPALFSLDPSQSDYAYVMPLPQRRDAPWGLAAHHPWFEAKLRKLVADAVNRGEGGLGGGMNGAKTEITVKELMNSPDRPLGGEKILRRVSLGGAPLRVPELSLFTFDVRAEDGTNVAKHAELGTSDRLVFATSEEFGGTLSLLGDEEKARNCNLHIRIDMLGKTPVARILRIDYLDAGEIVETLVERQPQPVNAGPGGEFFAPPPEGVATTGEDFRLFRFIDTSVKPGQRYRYRVKFGLRNPNRGVPRQHLLDPASADEQILRSKESNATAPVLVPEPLAMLVRTLRKADMKRFKPGAAEILVLAKSASTGDYSLRSLLTEPGGLSNVDSALNKPGDLRTRGDDVVTDRVLVDVRGRQEDRADLVKVAAPPEVLEMLFLAPDGSCELVSAADSEERYERYGSTLPVSEDRKAEPPASGEPAFSAPDILTRERNR